MGNKLCVKIQKDIFSVLNPEKRIGLTLRDSFIMSPSKSVTAFVGFGCGKEKTPGCAACNKADCLYQKNSLIKHLHRSCKCFNPFSIKPPHSTIYVEMRLSVKWVGSASEIWVIYVHLIHPETLRQRDKGTETTEPSPRPPYLSP